jgi:hypothetical protein
MPAKDRLHDTILRALQAGGWMVIREQVFIKIGGRHIWIDALIEREGEQRFIEIKGFENINSPIEYLASTVGQYVLYRAVLQDLEIRVPLFIALPTIAYETLMQEEIGQVIAANVKIQMVLIDIEREAVTRWI